jgi:hypothetical protein
VTFNQFTGKFRANYSNDHTFTHSINVLARFLTLIDVENLFSKSARGFDKRNETGSRQDNTIISPFGANDGECGDNLVQGDGGWFICLRVDGSYSTVIDLFGWMVVL